jgi:hypothetical protein
VASCRCNYYYFLNCSLQSATYEVYDLDCIHNADPASCQTKLLGSKRLYISIQDRAKRAKKDYENMIPNENQYHYDCKEKNHNQA